MRILLLTAALLAGCTANQAANHLEIEIELPDHFPEPTVPAHNPLRAESIELGRHLFYDTRLSGNKSISCSSCHKQEFSFADQRALSLGATNEEGRLNAPSLANVIYRAPMTWGHASIDDIEEQLLGPMFGEQPIEMAMSGAESQIVEELRSVKRYRDLFEDAYPGQEINLDNARLALASFVRSLVSANAPFDAFVQGQSDALSQAAQRGVELFYSDRLGCSA